MFAGIQPPPAERFTLWWASSGPPLPHTSHRPPARALTARRQDFSFNRNSSTQVVTGVAVAPSMFQPTSAVNILRCQQMPTFAVSLVGLTVISVGDGVCHVFRSSPIRQVTEAVVMSVSVQVPNHRIPGAMSLECCHYYDMDATAFHFPAAAKTYLCVSAWPKVRFQYPTSPNDCFPTPHQSGPIQ